jgi:hypothetical protein
MGPRRKLLRRQIGEVDIATRHTNYREATVDRAEFDQFADDYYAQHKANVAVTGEASERRSDTAFKRTTARAYYRLLNWMGVQIVYDHAQVHRNTL